MGGRHGGLFVFWWVIIAETAYFINIATPLATLVFAHSFFAQKIEGASRSLIILAFRAFQSGDGIERNASQLLLLLVRKHGETYRLEFGVGFQ